MNYLPALLLATVAYAQGVAVANVNDPRSHGSVGDGALSLDEAIRLLNEDLTVGNLSLAELSRITGVGPVRTIEIDAAVVATITLERLLTTMDGPPSHEDFDVECTGDPVIDATGFDVGLYVRTNHAHIHGLHIRGGRIGLQADTTVHLHPSEHLHLGHVAFGNQTQAGLRLQASGSMAVTMCMLSGAEFHDVPTGIEIDDRSTDGGRVMLESEFLDFARVQRGVDFHTDASGNTSMCMMFRSAIDDSDQLLRFTRSLTSNQRVMLMIVASEIRTRGDSFDIQGNADGETILHHHHSNIHAGAGARAFFVHPQDGRFDFHGSENVIRGDMLVEAGRLNRRLWIWNTIFRDSVIDISNVGTRPSMRWNRFENCTIRALPSNSSALAMSSSEFYNCTIEGQSRLGRVELSNCWLDQSNMVGEVSQLNPAPSPWLGWSWSSTATPLLGGTVDLTLDLPARMAGVWFLGVGDPRPLLTEEPWRFYAQLPTLMPLPGVFVFRSTVRLPIPVNRRLIGIEFYAQPVSVPYLGQAHVPEFSLPRGVYLRPQTVQR